MRAHVSEADLQSCDPFWDDNHSYVDQGWAILLILMLVHFTAVPSVWISYLVYIQLEALGRVFV